MSVNEKMTAIADAIRAKTGGTDALTLDGMAEAVPKVYDKGKQAEYDEFWDTYQQNGNRTEYSNAFAGVGWNNETFKPKYDLKPTNAYMMFRHTEIDEIYDTLDELGITLDTSNLTNAQYIFCTSRTKRIGVVDLSKATVTNYTFYGSAFETIEKLIFSENTVIAPSIFTNTSNLKNLTVEGVIAGSLDIGASKVLTVASLNSIITHLKDFSGTTTSRTLTLGEANLAKLADTEKAIATQKGWTLA